jgi:hypothetical protein
MTAELGMLLHSRADIVERARMAATQHRTDDARDTLLFAIARGVEGLLRASAIEARRAATENTGAVHESAVPNGETPK